jgi:ABC-type amino acid transport system permease subunit
MSAYACEIIRSGIQSIDPGQMEAAKSLGFSTWRAMRKIVLPQALKNLLPVLGNEFIVMVKASSQVSVIGLADLMFSATTVQGISFQPFPPLVIVAVIYLIITVIISSLIRLMENNLSKSNGR